MSFFEFRGLADPILFTLSLARYLEVLAGYRVAYTVALVELGWIPFVIFVGPPLSLRTPKENYFPGPASSFFVLLFVTVRRLELPGTYALPSL